VFGIARLLEIHLYTALKDTYNFTAVFYLIFLVLFSKRHHYVTSAVQIKSLLRDVFLCKKTVATFKPLSSL